MVSLLDLRVNLTYHGVRMKNQPVEAWIKARGLRPELAAAIFDISLSTLKNHLRGARVSEWTAQKIKTGMRKYDQEHPAKRAS